MDHHTVAATSITGICLDVFGGFYLAYALLGGQHGPLRLLTRMVTYSIVFGLGYGQCAEEVDARHRRRGATKLSGQILRAQGVAAAPGPRLCRIVLEMSRIACGDAPRRTSGGARNAGHASAATGCQALGWRL